KVTVATRCRAAAIWAYSLTVNTRKSAEPPKRRPRKAFIYWTVRDTVAECVIVPLVPVIVRVRVPVRVVDVVLMVRVLVPDPVTEAGEKLAVAPRGRFETLRLTAPVKPFSAPTVTV